MEEGMEEGTEKGMEEGMEEGMEGIKLFCCKCKIHDKSLFHHLLLHFLVQLIGPDRLFPAHVVKVGASRARIYVLGIPRLR